MKNGCKKATVHLDECKRRNLSASLLDVMSTALKI